ncbi:MAG: DUF3029 family protein [Acidimicrobiia bacterium]|nr:DUF3029 family protein [Acidimicrobiia bacterium]
MRVDDPGLRSANGATRKPPVDQPPVVQQPLAFSDAAEAASFAHTMGGVRSQLEQTGDTTVATSVWNLDRHLEPTSGALTPIDLRSAIGSLWRDLIDASPTGSAHVTVGPDDGRVLRSMLGLTPTLAAGCATVAMRISSKTPNGIIKEAVRCALDTGQPTFVNDEALTRSLGNGYGVVPGGYALPSDCDLAAVVRLDLADAVRRHSGEPADIADRAIPAAVDAAMESLETQVTLASAATGCRHTAAIEVAGLAAAAQQLVVRREHREPVGPFGYDDTVNDAAADLADAVMDAVGEHALPRCDATSGTPLVHARISIPEPSGGEIGETMRLLEQIRALAPIHRSFYGHAMSVVTVDETMRSNLSAASDFIRGAFASGLGMVSLAMCPYRPSRSQGSIQMPAREAS